MTAPVVREHDEAVRDAVGTVGRPTGLVRAPAGALDALLGGTGPGYYIVYPVSGGDRDGPVVDPWADIEVVYQVTCIDISPEGARWLADQLDSALAALTVPDRSVMWVKPQNSGVWNDDDTAEKTLFFSTPLFRIKTTP